MKGRILDPKLGRFLTTDPIVSNLYDGQSLNSYAYVLNNPLAFVDPSGFQGVPASPVLWMPEGQAEDVVTPGAGFRVAQYLNHEGPAPSTPGKSASDAAKSGAAAPATDVDTTGSSKEKDPESEDPTPPEGWTQIPYVQVEGGFFAGVSLGLVPFGGVGQQVLDAAEVLPHGTPEARRGLAVGQVVGGLITLRRFSRGWRRVWRDHSSCTHGHCAAAPTTNRHLRTGKSRLRGCTIHPDTGRHQPRLAGLVDRMQL